MSELSISTHFYQPPQIPEGEFTGSSHGTSKASVVDVENLRPPQQPEALCFATEDPILIQKAQILTANEYLRRGFIQPNEVGEDGVILPEHDPYRSHSTYFVKTTPDGSEVVATVRVIKYDAKKGDKSFPVLDHKDELDPEYVDRLQIIGAENLLEVSALARDKKLDKDGTAAIELYKEMMLNAWESDETGKGTLIMACNPVLYEGFRMLFDGAMKRIGPDLPYPGQEAIPAMLELTDGSVRVADISNDPNNPFKALHKAVVNYFFTGVDAKKINPRIMQGLYDNGYTALAHKMEANEWPNLEHEKVVLQKRIKTAGIQGKVLEKLKKYKPEIIANIALAVYTALRTVGVAQGVDPYSDTNWESFLAVELGTQVPYTWGFSDIIRGSMRDNYPRSRKALAATAIGSAFVAPYAYLAANGATESLEGAMTTGTILGVGAYFLSKNIKKIRDRNKSQNQQ
ncbi:MAG: hypothetical protein WAQ24_00065 [Candidatus Saccharimonadales bacterium]